MLGIYPAPRPPAELPTGHPAPQRAKTQSTPCPEQPKPSCAPEGAHPPQHLPAAARPTAPTATGTAITPAPSGAFKNTPWKQFAAASSGLRAPTSPQSPSPPRQLPHGAPLCQVPGLLSRALEAQGGGFWQLREFHKFFLFLIYFPRGLEGSGVPT